MSNTIDDRIVRMEFVNDKFERGVEGTIRSLERLKQGLDLTAASNALKGLQVTGDHFSLAGIGHGVDQLVGRFSTLGIVGMTIIQNLTNSALNMGKKIAGAITGPLVEGGKKRALAIAQAKFQFEGLGMDIEATMKNANDAVSGTAYGLADAAMVASQLGASGMRAGDEMMSSLRGIAGVAAMAGREYSDIGNIFVSVAGNGRLMGNQLLQLSSSGVNAAAVLAKSLGKTESEVREMVTKGQISFKMFSDAMDEAFGKHAQAANKLYTGALANVKSALGRIGADVAAKHFDNLRDILNALRPVINEVHKALGPLIADFNRFTTEISANVIKGLEGKDLLPLTLSLQAIQNVFKGLYSILTPIKEAFQEIFPSKTRDQLMGFAIELVYITSKFKMGEEQLTNIKNTFRGLFAVLDIGIYIVTGVAKALLSMAGPLLPIADGMLNVTGTIGNFLVRINKAIKEVDIFKDSFNKMAGVMGPAADFIRSALVALSEAIKALTESGSVDEFTERVGGRFSGLSKAIDFLHDSLMKLLGVFQKTFPIFGTLAKVIGTAISDLGGVILKAFNEGNFKTIFDLVNGTLMTGLLIGINKYIHSITNIATKGGFLQNITGVFNGVRASLRLWQQELQAKVLRSIAMSIGILAVSLVAISLIDSAKLTASLGAIAALLAELFTAMAFFGKLAGVAGLFGVAKIILAMQGLAVAVLILTVALSKLAKLEWEEIKKGLTGVAGLCLILVATSTLLSKAKTQMVSGSVGLILFAVALGMLADAVIKLGVIDIEELKKGLVSIGILILELSIFMKLTSGKGMGASSSLGLIALAYALLTLAKAVEAFASLSVEELKQGLVAVASILGMLAIFVNVTGKAKNVITTAAGITILALAMNLLVVAIEKLGLLPLDVLQKGLVSMGVALGAIAIAMNLMPKGMIAKSAGLVVVAGALLILSEALTRMGGMQWDEIGRGLAVLAASLTIIAIAMIFMSKSIAGAAALLIVSAALSVLAGVLQELGSMSLEEIGKSLLALVGVFVVLGVAGLVLSPLVPTLLALGAAVLLLGVGCLAVGAGLMLFAAGLTALSIALVAGSGAILAFITSILGMLPLIIEQLGIALVALTKVVILAAPAIGKAVEAILLAIIQTIKTVTPPLIKTLLELLTKVLKAITKALPEMMKAAKDLIVAFLKGMGDMLPEVVGAAIKFIVAFVNALASAIDNNGDELIGAFVNLIKVLVKTALKVLLAALSFFADAGDQLIKEVIAAFKKKIGAFVETIGEFISGGITALGEAIGEFYNAGIDIITGFIDGIKSKISDAKSAAGDLGRAALQAAKDALRIKSPSKAFEEEVGAMIAEGMAKGIKKDIPKAVAAAKQMAQDVLNTAKEFIDERKFYNKISLEEELYVWETIQKKYQAGTDARKQADREVYQLKNQMIAVDKAANEKLIADKQNAEREAFNKSIEWMDERKYYNELSLAEELATWEKMQFKYLKGTEERKKADREVYRLKQEINALNESYSQRSLDIEAARIDALISLEEDYYAKTKSINDKLKQDIASVNKEYEDAVDSRAKSLYNSYGLFDRVNTKKPVSGITLIENLKTQVTDFESWRKNMDELSQKGIADGLLTELEAMGPSAASQIAGLNTLSESELATYVSLWQTKHREAKTQAIDELEGIRSSTLNTISKLKKQASQELTSYRKMWNEQMLGVNTDADVQLATLNAEWAEKLQTLRAAAETEFTTMSTNVSTTVTTLKTNVETEFEKLAANIQTIMATPNWPGVGDNIIAGMIDGINAKAEALAMTVARAAKRALDAAKRELGIKSPSKAFEQVGMYSMQGMVVGLDKFSVLVTDKATSVGESAVDALKSAISNISEVVNNNVDINPTIRPVIDLTDVVSGARMIGSILNGGQGINVTNAANRAASSMRRVQTSTDSQSNIQNGRVAEKTITQNLKIYSPKALSPSETARLNKRSLQELALQF